MIYGEKIVFSGPRIVSAASSGGTVTVKYDAIGTEGKGIKLRSNGGRDGLTYYGFEVSSTATDATGKAGTWSRVNVTSATKDTVSFRAAGKVMAIRYAWEDSPSIFNKDKATNVSSGPVSPRRLFCFSFCILTTTGGRRSLASRAAETCPCVGRSRQCVYNGEGLPATPYLLNVTSSN